MYLKRVARSDKSTEKCHSAVPLPPLRQNAQTDQQNKPTTPHAYHQTDTQS